MRFLTAISLVAAFAFVAIAMVNDHPATASDQPAVVFSHFECYTPVQPGPPPPAPRNVVQLTDQFQMIQTKVGPSELFCTPVMKKLQQGVHPLPVPPPANHLTCYAIMGPTINHVVLASNQLQKQQLQLGTPALLCVPTNKKVIH
jgi:hypothetical protein